MGIFDCDESEEEPQDYQLEPTKKHPTPSVLRIEVRQYPYLNTFYRPDSVRITIESGATGNIICLSTVQKLKVEICKSAQSAYQGDGSSPLKVIGETKLSFTRRKHVFQCEGLVVENLDVVVLAGSPFMEANDIAGRPAKRLIPSRMAPPAHTALLMIVLHSKLRVALWFSALTRVVVTAQLETIASGPSKYNLNSPLPKLSSTPNPP